MKTKVEIVELLNDAITGIEEYKLSEEGGDLINQGWVEALCCVLDLEVCRCGKRPTEEGYTSCSVCLDAQDQANNLLNGRD